MTCYRGIIDIYALICPKDNEVKWVGASKSGNIPFWLRNHNSYKQWSRMLGSIGLKQEVIILESIPDHEVSFLLSFYQDLFRSWGFNLFTNEFKAELEIEAHNIASELKELVRWKNINSKDINHHNSNLVPYYELPKIERQLEHLSKNCSTSKHQTILMEVQLFLCLTCYMGMSPAKVAKLKWSDLRNRKYSYSSERNVFLIDDQHTLDVARNLFPLRSKDSELIFNSFKWGKKSIMLAHIINSLFYILRSNIRIGTSDDLNAIYALLTFDRYGRGSINSHLLVDYFGLDNMSELVCLLDRFCTNERKIRMVKYGDHKRIVFTNLY